MLEREDLPPSEQPAAIVYHMQFWYYRDKNMHMMLIVPGRIGTSSPEPGVPTAFSDISAFEVVCELEETKAGYDPELSYGSHIFQDLVEAKILYTAVFHNHKTPVSRRKVLREQPISRAILMWKTSLRVS